MNVESKIQLPVAKMTPEYFYLIKFRNTDQTCGCNKVPTKLKVLKMIWWWNDTVDRKVKATGQAWKMLKENGNRKYYRMARRIAKRRIFLAKAENERNRFANVLQCKK